MRKWLSRILIFAILLVTVVCPTAFALALHAVLMEDVSANISDTSVGRTFQRDTFYGGGRAWVFYMGFDPANVSHIYYRSSTDGVTWATRTLFCNITNADQFSLYWDGTYVHTVWVDNSATQAGVSYRRGTPNSNGTITWVATQAVRIPSIADGYFLPTITAYAGRPYLAYGYYVGPTSLWAAESSNVTTGLWSSDVLFRNLDLTAGNFTATACIDAFPGAGIINVTVEVVVPPAISQEVGTYMYFGGGWTAYQTVDSAGTPSELFSTIAWDNVINVIFVRSAPAWHTYHRQSADGGIWVAAPVPTDICNGAYQIASLSLYDNTNGDLKCFFADGPANNIAWKFYDNVMGAWDVAYTELVTVIACDRLQTSVSHQSPLGVVYEVYALPDIDSVYYDYYDSFPASPAVVAMIANMNFWIYMVALILAGLGILYLFGTIGQGSALDNARVIVAIAVMLVVGVVICMAFLQ